MFHVLMVAAIVTIAQARPAPAPTSAPAPAQTPAPARSAEVQKLGAFLGEWRMKEDKPDSINRTICQWAPSGQCLLCDQIHPGPEGPTKPSVRELNVFTFDRGKKAYVMQGLRPARSAQFTVSGPTWTYPGEYVENGKKITQRVLNTWESPAVMHYTVESSQDGGAHWATQADGRMVRTKALPSTGVVSASTGTLPAPALSALVGTWRTTGARKATAFGPAAALSATTTCRWSPNGAFLVCDQLAAGGADVLTIYSYTESDQRYHFQSLSPHGGAVQNMDLTVSDRQLTYTGAFQNGATPARVRVTQTIVSTGTVHYKEEASVDGATWVTTSEGDQTKLR